MTILPLIAAVTGWWFFDQGNIVPTANLPFASYSFWITNATDGGFKAGMIPVVIDSGNFTVSSNGTVYIGANITNAALTASRMVLTDVNKALASAAASGAVSVNADGTATTAAQITALYPERIITNKEATAVLFNGNITNASLTASRLVISDVNKALSSAAASGSVPVDADGSATIFSQLNAIAPGYIVTNNNANVHIQAAELDLTGTTNYVAGTVRIEGGINVATNITAAPNMDKLMSLTNIGAAFTMAGPINVDGGFTIGKQTLWQITNNTAAAVLVTAAANVHTYWWGTNVTGFYVTNYAPIWVTTYGKLTNAYVGPGF